MKFILAVALVVFAVVGLANAGTLNEQQKAQDLKYANECIAEHHVNQKAAMAVIGGKFDNVDDKMKCFTDCFMAKHGFTGPNAAQNVFKSLVSLIGKEKVMTLLKTCGATTGVNQCDKSFQTYKCFYNNGGVSA